MSILIGFLLGVHILICIALVGVVLMQLPRSEGLGAAFGGGVTENVFGAQTTNVLAKITVWLGVGFFAVTLLLAIAYSHNRPSAAGFERDLLSAPIPEDAAKPSVAPSTPAAQTGKAASADSLTPAPETPPAGITPRNPEGAPSEVPTPVEPSTRETQPAQP